MLNNYNSLNPFTLYSFFPKTQRLRLSKDGINFLTQNNSNLKTRQDSFSNIKTKANSNLSNKTITPISSKNTKKFNYTFYGKNFRNNNFIENSKTKFSHETSIDKKNSLNSHLFESFINSYENKVKKTLNSLNNLNYKNNLPFIKEKKKRNSNNNINNSSKKNFFNNFHPLYKNSFQTNYIYNFPNNNNNNNNNLNLNNKNNLQKTKKIYNPINFQLEKQIEKRSISTAENNNIILLSNGGELSDKLSKYSIGREIGKGAYATCKVIINKITKIKYAMKIYDKSKLNDNSKKKCVIREIEVMKHINHKNIVKLHEIINTSKQILIIMEYINGISLREYYNKEIRNQKTLPIEREKLIKNFFIKIFSAMGYLHRNHMAHRDIKLENILIDRNFDIKIIDFGFGMYNPENKLQNFFCGTPNYMPPEISAKKCYVGQKADMWSLGILFYKMLCADFPFKGENEKELYKDVRKCKIKIPFYIKEDIKDIIFSLINLNPDKRPSCEEVLKFKWFNEDDDE